MSPDVLAAAYLKQYRTGADEDSWAFEEVLEVCGELQAGLALTLRLLELAADDTELAYVAAGPVEDLLKWHGKAAAAAFEKAAAQSEKVRRALSAVWLNQGHEAFAQWKRLMDMYYPGEFNWRSAGSRRTEP